MAPSSECSRHLHYSSVGVWNEGQTFCLTSLPYNVPSPHYPLPFLAPSIPNLPKFPIYSLSIYLQSLCLIPFPSPHCHSLALIPVCIFYTDRGSVTTKKTDEANCTSQSNLTTHTHTHILTISTHYFSSTRSLPMNISTGRQHSRQISCRMHITQSSILGALCQQETVRMCGMHFLGKRNVPVAYPQSERPRHTVIHWSWA